MDHPHGADESTLNSTAHPLPSTPGSFGALEREKIISPSAQSPFRPVHRSKAAAASSVLHAKGMPDIRSWQLVGGKGTVRQKNMKGIEHQFKSTAQQGDIRAATFIHRPSEDLTSRGDFTLKTNLSIGRLPFTVLNADILFYHQNLDEGFDETKPSRYFGAECTCLQLHPQSHKVVLKAYGGEGSSILYEVPCPDLRPNFPLRVQVTVSPSRRRGTTALPGCQSFLTVIVNDRRLLDKYLVPEGVFLNGPVGMAVAVVDTTVSTWQVYENGAMSATMTSPGALSETKRPMTKASRPGTSAEAVDPNYGVFQGQRSMSRGGPRNLGLPSVTGGQRRSPQSLRRRSLPNPPRNRGNPTPPRSGPPAHAMRAATSYRNREAQVWSNDSSPRTTRTAQRTPAPRTAHRAPAPRTAPVPRPPRTGAHQRSPSTRHSPHYQTPRPRRSNGPPIDETPAQKPSAVRGDVADVVRDMMLTAEQCAAAAPKEVVALDDAKRLLHEACVLPLIIPEHFQGIREPWRGILLFGPPGTGKTMLARMTAAACGASFFNCAASSLLSSLYGQSEKVIAALFTMARENAPSIVFFDEIDALMSERGSTREHEASRRVKSQLLSELDGIHSAAGHETGGNRIVMIATTNRPWDLDEAMRRRLEKRIHIGLPNPTARKQLFQSFLKGVQLSPDVNFSTLADMTQGYSGADVRLVCREAALHPVRSLIAGKSADEIRALSQAGALTTAITMQHLSDAIANTKPSVNEGTLPRYHDWMAQYGSK